MILHRFCSTKEFEAYQRGDMLINNTDHRLKRGNAAFYGHRLKAKIFRQRADKS